MSAFANSDRPHVVFLCTGNAARSVMATIMTRARTDAVTVSGAGTHSIEGLPMSVRTRKALLDFDLVDHDHRSHQLVADDVERADLIVAFEPNHLAYVRKRHPDGAAKTALLPRLARDLGGEGSLVDRVRALNLAALEAEPWEEVVDPAGGEQDVFDASAAEISDLLDALIPALGPPEPARPPASP